MKPQTDMAGFCFGVIVVLLILWGVFNFGYAVGGGDAEQACIEKVRIQFGGWRE